MKKTMIALLAIAALFAGANAEAEAPAEEPVAEEAPSEEPVIEEPVIDEPVIEEPVVDESAEELLKWVL